MLSASGEDPEWVKTAGDDMSRLISVMCPRVRWVYSVVGGLGAMISLGIVVQVVDSPYREIAIAVGIVGAAAFLLGSFNHSSRQYSSCSLTGSQHGGDVCFMPRAGWRDGLAVRLARGSSAASRSSSLSR